jgi:UDP-N-acetylmuramyl tripeptide synthase
MGAKRYLAEYEIEKPIEIIQDRKKAIYRLIELAEKGDVVVTTW